MRISSSILRLPIHPTRVNLANSAFTFRKMSSSPYSIVSTEKAPSAIGPYVQAVKHNGIIYASGCIPLIPETMQMTDGGIEAQTEQVFKNAQAVMEAAGSDKSHVLKTTVFLQSMSDFVAFNKLYESFFAPYKPARSCVEVAKLPKDALVEMEFICAEKK